MRAAASLPSMALHVGNASLLSVAIVARELGEVSIEVS